MFNFQKITKDFNVYTKHSAFVLQMIILVIGLTLIGYYLDNWIFNKMYIFTILLSFASIILVVYLIIREFSSKKKQNENHK